MGANDLVPEPLKRRLRIFALDPSIAAQHDTAGIGEITVPVQWEQNLQPGPIGEYIEVVDADPLFGAGARPERCGSPSFLIE